MDHALCYVIPPLSATNVQKENGSHILSLTAIGNRSRHPSSIDILTIQTFLRLFK